MCVFMHVRVRGCICICMHACMTCGSPWLSSFKSLTKWSSLASASQNLIVFRYLGLGLRLCPTTPSFFIGPGDELMSSCLQDNTAIFLTQLAPFERRWTRISDVHLIPWENHRISLTIVNELFGCLWRVCTCKAYRLGICGFGQLGRPAFCLSIRGFSTLLWFHELTQMLHTKSFPWGLWLRESVLCFLIGCCSGRAGWLIISLTCSCCHSWGHCRR